MIFNELEGRRLRGFLNGKKTDHIAKTPLNNGTADG